MISFINMEERLKNALLKIPFDEDVLEEFSSFIDDISENINRYRLGEENEEIFMKMINKLMPVLKQEGYLITLNDVNKLKVCGDLHGDLESLINFIEVCDLNEDYIIFLGDYIDKGSYSVQVLLIVLLLKIAIPKRVVLLRGNHENELCNFYNLHSFLYKTLNGYDIYSEFFVYLPLVCTVNDKMLLMHGMIPNVANMQDLFNQLQNPNRELMECITWGDININKDGEEPDFGSKYDHYNYYEDEYDEEYEEEYDEEEEVDYKMIMKKDLRKHEKGIYLRIDDLFNIMKSNNYELVVRGHSFIKKGFHVIKYGDIAASNSYVKRRSINVQPSVENPFFISLHSYKDDEEKDMVPAYIDYNILSKSCHIYQLEKKIKEEE